MALGLSHYTMVPLKISKGMLKNIWYLHSFLENHWLDFRNCWTIPPRQFDGDNDEPPLLWGFPIPMFDFRAVNWIWCNMINPTPRPVELGLHHVWLYHYGDGYQPKFNGQTWQTNRSSWGWFKGKSATMFFSMFFPYEKWGFPVSSTFPFDQSNEAAQLELCLAS